MVCYLKDVSNVAMMFKPEMAYQVIRYIFFQVIYISYQLRITFKTNKHTFAKKIIS